MAKKSKQADISPITLTKKAIAQVKLALQRERSPDSGVRFLLLEVSDGFRYDIQIETKERDGDHISLQGGLTVYVDTLTSKKLHGMKIDFIDTPKGSGFLFGDE